MAIPLLVAAQTIYRTLYGQDRRSAILSTMAGSSSRAFGTGPRLRRRLRGGSSWNHDYPAADFYISDALDTLTRMRVNDASTNVLELEDPSDFRQSDSLHLRAGLLEHQ